MASFEGVILSAGAPLFAPEPKDPYRYRHAFGPLRSVTSLRLTKRLGMARKAQHSQLE
jgi:hypothetical protein